MYTSTNFKTKKALKIAVEEGKEVSTYQPGGMFEGVRNGHITLEGPHYPESHKWYAQAEVRDGIIVKGSIK